MYTRFCTTCSMGFLVSKMQCHVVSLSCSVTKSGHTRNICKCTQLRRILPQTSVCSRQTQQFHLLVSLIYTGIWLTCLVGQYLDFTYLSRRSVPIFHLPVSRSAQTYYLLTEHATKTRVTINTSAAHIHLLFVTHISTVSKPTHAVFILFSFVSSTVCS